MSQSDKKKEFHEILSELIEFATVSGNIISKDTIGQYFKDFTLDDTQFNFIYQYLNDAKIQIEGFEDRNTVHHVATSDTDLSSYNKAVKESNEALNFHEMYLNELSSLSAVEKEEAETLLNNLSATNPDTIEKLTALYLPVVIQLSEQFENKGLSHSDLVAEGNLALLEGIYEFCDNSVQQNTSVTENFEAFINEKITKAITGAINAEIGSNRISDHLVDQINALNNASTELAKEYGREASLEELCQYLSLSEDEVKELMKVSIQALTVTETDEA